MSVKIFLSTVSDEFRPYRDQLRADLTRHNVEVKVQEDFKDLGGDTLDKLDVYIAHCDAVVHLVGDMTGAAAGARIQRRCSTNIPPAGQIAAAAAGSGGRRDVSYTQWEAWLALYHGKRLVIAKAADTAARGPTYAPTESHAPRSKRILRGWRGARYPGCTFASSDDLAKHIATPAILDLLVEDYAQEAARAREVAEGSSAKWRGRWPADPHLDFDGMKQAVRNAIEIYEKEIAGGQNTNQFRRHRRRRIGQGAGARWMRASPGWRAPRCARRQRTCGARRRNAANAMSRDNGALRPRAGHRLGGLRRRGRRRGHRRAGRRRSWRGCRGVVLPEFRSGNEAFSIWSRSGQQRASRRGFDCVVGANYWLLPRPTKTTGPARHNARPRARSARGAARAGRRGLRRRSRPIARR